MDEGVSGTNLLSEFVYFMSGLGSSWVSGTEPVTESAPTGAEATFPSGIPVYVTDIPAAIARSESLAPLAGLWEIYVPIALFTTLLFCVGIAYCIVRVFQIRKLENAHFAHMAHTVRAKDTPKTSLRWHRIMEQMESGNEHNWRLAVLEADIMLNELLDTLGYKGETMADKMKQVDRAQFNSIDEAWEAHKFRNKVAHEGSEHSVTERDANRIIGLYRRVFTEFKAID